VEPDRELGYCAQRRNRILWRRVRVRLTAPYGDLQNLQPLPSYSTLDIGASLLMNDGLELRFTGLNVTNTLGITEGNSRVVGSGVDAGGVFLGRPLFGPDYQISLKMTF
jgi:outer membrane receptor protein involved in Fe transport